MNSLAHLLRGLGVVAALRPGVAKAQLHRAPSYGGGQLATAYRAPRPRRNTNKTTMSTKRSRPQMAPIQPCNPVLAAATKQKKPSQHVWVAEEDLHRRRPRGRRPAAGHAPRQNNIRHQLQVPVGNELAGAGTDKVGCDCGPARKVVCALCKVTCALCIFQPSPPRPVTHRYQSEGSVNTMMALHSAVQAKQADMMVSPHKQGHALVLSHTPGHGCKGMLRRADEGRHVGAAGDFGAAPT